jgi:hypothetical protein
MNPTDAPQPFVTAYEDAPAYWSIGILWNVLISADRSFGNFTLMDQTMPRGVLRSRWRDHLHRWS